MSDFNWDWHCSVIDCPLHPVHKENERIVAEKKRKAEAELRAKEIIDKPDNIDQHDIYVNNNLSLDTLHISNISANQVFGSWTDYYFNLTSSNVDCGGTVIKTEYMDHSIPIECLMCSHMEKKDMRDVIIVQKAKKALKED